MKPNRFDSWLLGRNAVNGSKTLELGKLPFDHVRVPRFLRVSVNCRAGSDDGTVLRTKSV